MTAEDEQRRDVLIVGGGTASLFLAQHLLDHPRGLSVQVLERGDAAQRSQQGVLVHPITQHLIEQRYPGHEWNWSGVVQRLREYRDERLLSELDAGVDDLGKTKRFSCNTRLADIDAVITGELEKHPNARLSYRTEVVSIEFDSDAWRVTVDTPEGVKHIRATVLVAADGRDSALRDWLDVPCKVEPFPGSVDIFAFGDRRADTPAVSMIHGSDGATTVVDNGMGPNTLIFDMRTDGTPPQSRSSLRQTAVRRAGIAGLDIANPDQPLFGTSIRSATVSCDTWLARQAIVFGDAAHAMHNVGGQGFNLTIQDAVALAPGIAEWVGGSNARLSEFESFRLPYITEIQQRQNRLFHSLASTTHDVEGGWFFPLRHNLIEGQDGLYSYLWTEGMNRDA